MVRTVAWSRRGHGASAAYDVGVRKWLLAVGALVLAVAVAVTVWALTRSDDSGSKFASPRQAVLATCHAEAAYGMPKPGGDAVGPWQIYHAYRESVQRGRFIMYWRAPKKPPLRFAVVQRITSGNYRVITCAPRTSEFSGTRLLLPSPSH